MFICDSRKFGIITNGLYSSEFETAENFHTQPFLREQNATKPRHAIEVTS